MIPRSYIENFTRGINAISAQAQSTLDAALQGIDLTGDVADVRRQVVSVMQGICGTSTDAAAQLAAQFYDGLRFFELGETMGAQPTSGREAAATEGAVRAFADKLVKGKPDSFVNLLGDRVDYEIKVAASQTCLNNAKRDRRKPRFARVPTGIETCDFCIMLASRGFVYHTEAAASHAHAGCDCRIVPSWKSDEVEGYDPDDLYQRYKETYRRKCSDIDSRLARPAREFRKREKYLRKNSEHMSDEERAKFEGDLREYYFEKIGNQIESFSKDGLIHVEYGAIPHGKEILTGKTLARDGREITYLRERDDEGVKNLDIVLDGRLFELKCVDLPRREQSGREPLRYVENNLKKACVQFENPHYGIDGEIVAHGEAARVVFDSRGRDDDDALVAAQLRKKSANGKFDTLTLIGQFEDVIDIVKET